MYEGVATHILPWLKGCWNYPYGIHLFPTDRCNLKCRLCWRWNVSVDGEIPRFKDEMGDEKLLSIIDEGASLGVKEWEFTGGGEPLMRKNVVLKMMEKIKKGNMRGEVTTNGTLFTPEIVEFMVKIKWDKIILSLDGSNAEINDYLRPPSGSFQRIIYMLQLFREYKDHLQIEKPEISIQSTLSKVNVDYIVPMLKLTAEYEAIGVIFEPVKYFSHRCAELMLEKQDYEKIKQQAKEALEIASKNNVFTNVGWLVEQPEYIENIGKIDNFLTSSYHYECSKTEESCFLRSPCYEPWYRMYISATGEVSPCCLAKYNNKKNVKHNSLLDVWMGDFFRNFRNDILNKRFPESCKQCNASLIMHSDAIRKELIKAWEGEKANRNISTNINEYGKKALNICLVSREYPPETGWGGIGNYTYNLAHGLSTLGCHVHVIAQSMDVDKDYLDGDIHVHRIAHKTIFPFKGRIREFCLRLEYSQTVYKKLKEIIKRFHIDIVETPNFSAEGFVYSLFKKIPLVTRLHTHFSEIIEFSHWSKTLDRNLSCSLEDAAILRSDLITCSTRRHKEVIFREVGLDSKNVEIIPLGVPLPDIKEEYFDKNKNGPIVLFVGRLEKRKGVHILIKSIPCVLKEIPNTTFILVGRDTFISPDFISFNGQERYSFKAQIIKDIPKQYQQNIRFLGYVDNVELSKYYRSCDIFVAPSLYESFGFIYIEAMSYAKPVIGCGVGGVPEVITDEETGILVPPEDPYLLAKAIIRLLKDTNLRMKMGNNARKDIEKKYTIEHMTEKTLSVYKKVLGVS